MSFDAKEEIKSKLDIVDVVSSYIKVQKAGANYKACCPFHNEKTPSLVVSPQRQMYKCFGCGNGGDIFTFVMGIENCDFPSALKILADKAGVTLPKYDKENTSQNQILYHINNEAVSHFEKNLKTSNNILEYLKNRNLSLDIINEFHLGFAIDSWNDLSDLLSNKNYSINDIIASGLVIQKPESKNAFHDRFRSRIMFPIYNTSNEPVGFTGRIFEPANGLKTIKNIDETGKYINSPQTPIYEKGKILYGFNITKKYIKEQNEAVVVEGTMDFLSGYCENVKNIVASLGTALTFDQLTLLKRFCIGLILAYDNDEAGRLATERNIKLALSMGFNIKILVLDDCKDLSDFIGIHKNELPEKVKNSIPIMQFYFNRGLKLFNVNITSGKNEFLNYFLSKVHWLKDILEVSEWLNKVSKTLDINQELVDNSYKQIKSEVLENELKVSNLKKDTQNINFSLKSRKDILSEKILSTFLCHPVLLRNTIVENEKYFPQLFKPIIELIKNSLNSLNDSSLDPDLKDQIDILYILGEQNEDIKNMKDADITLEINDTIKMLKEECLKHQFKNLETAIHNAEIKNDSNLLLELLNKFNETCAELKKLKE